MPNTAPECLRALVRATFHMADTSTKTGDAFPNAHADARAWLALYDAGAIDPAGEFLAHLAAIEARRPDLAEYVRRLAGSVRKLRTMI